MDNKLQMLATLLSLLAFYNAHLYAQEANYYPSDLQPTAEKTICFLFTLACTCTVYINDNVMGVFICLYGRRSFLLQSRKAYKGGERFYFKTLF